MPKDDDAYLQPADHQSASLLKSARAAQGEKSIASQQQDCIMAAPTVFPLFAILIYLY